MFDEEGAKVVGSIMEKAAAKGVAIHLPFDHVTADKVCTVHSTCLVPSC